MVGLDTMAHVIKTMADTLPDDPWHAYFQSPKWLDALIAKGALGQKTGAGIFRKAGKDILVLDLQKQDYCRPTARGRAGSGRNPNQIPRRSSRNCAPAASAGEVPVGAVRDLFHIAPTS